MPDILLIMFTIISFIVCVISVFMYKDDSIEKTGVFCGVIQFIIICSWLILYWSCPKEIEKEYRLNIVKVKTPSGYIVDVIFDDDDKSTRCVNLNDKYRVSLDNFSKVHVTKYKRWYYGVFITGDIFIYDYKLEP